MKIYCSRCGRTITVKGVIWKHRLRFPYAKRDNQGRYLGWHCDQCTDEIERGID